MDQLLNANGTLPWMPASLSQEEQQGWMKGWEYEEEFFNEGDNTLLPPSHLPHVVRSYRTAVLQSLVDMQQPDTETLGQQAAAIDRILLGSAPDQPDQWLPILDTFHHVFQSMETLVLDIQTPYTWFRRYIKQLPDELLFHVLDVDDIFVAVALDGRVAHHRPSVVAAAILAFLLGGDKAEPYLCGYELFDVWMARSHIEDILQEKALATDIEY